MRFARLRHGLRADGSTAAGYAGDGDGGRANAPGTGDAGGDG